MSLIDPYSQTRLFELRQEQLARKARRRQQLGIEAGPSLRGSLATGAQAMLRRITRTKASRPAPVPGRPALDS